MMKGLFTLITAWFVCMSVIVHAEVKERPEILIIHSYSQSFPWTKFQMEGLQNTFNKAFPDREIPVEYLDWKNFPHQENLQLFKKQLRMKYAHRNWDVVITTDNAALDLALELRSELFPEAYLIFTGINDYDPRDYTGQSRLTGVIETVDWMSTIHQMLKIHPQARELVVIMDSTEISRALLKEFQRLMPQWKNRVRITTLHDLEMGEILKRVNELPSEALLLVTNFTMDQSKKIFTSREAIRLISQKGHVPVYGLWDMQLGYGIVGGWLLDGHLQGSIAADLALKVLKGEQPPVVTKSSSRYYLDYKQMERYKITLSNATEDAVMINYPLPIYKKYLPHIIVAIITILILFILNLFLIRNIRKRQAAERLAEESNQARETFMTISAHEFRTPLTVLLFQLQLLLKMSRGETKKKPDPEDMSKAADMALVQGRRIHQLVENLLLASKKGTFGGLLTVSETDLRTVINKVAKELKHPLQTSGSTLDLKFEGPCIGQWEERKIEKLMSHLLSNAIKFGNGKAIEVSATTEAEGVTITVKDQGIGIHLEDKDKIFEKFGRAVSEYNFGGFGLGLYLSQRIIALHKGKISVESEPNKGTQFTVYLPFSPSRNS